MDENYNDLNERVNTGKYNIQLENYRREMQAFRAQFSVIADNLRVFSTLEGSNDTEKFQWGMDNGTSIILDVDITIDEVFLRKKNVYIYGQGHEIHMRGKVSSDVDWVQMISFYDCVFNGSDGGYFYATNRYLVNVRYINCLFYMFKNDVFTGNLQGFMFIGCEMRSNEKWFINSQRCDAVNIGYCNVESSNGGFWKTNDATYGCTFKNSVCENLKSGAAIEWEKFGDCELDTLYFENNDKDIVLTVDYTGCMTIKDIHGNTKKGGLITLLKESITAPQYGIIQVSGCSVGNNAVIVDLSDTSAQYKITCVNCMIGQKHSEEYFDKTKVTSKQDKFITSDTVRVTNLRYTGICAATGTWLNLKTLNSPASGHVTLGFMVRVMSNSRFKYEQIPYMDGDQFLLVGDGVNSYNYELSVFYK